MALTDDGRWHWVQSPLIVESPITLDNGYEESWVQLAATYNLHFYAVWAMLESTQNPDGIPVWGIQIEYTENGQDIGRFFVMRRLDATQTQFDRAWDAAGLTRTAWPSCLDENGDTIFPDEEYYVCRDTALEDYLTAMNNRTRSFIGRGVLGILLTGGGVACIAFPPCALSIGVPLLMAGGLDLIYQGVDLWTDTANYQDILFNDLNDCCNELRLRQ